ncbi:MAG TPA: hypothetical protein RMH85_07475 [Polyangiaceae bacterium LLY-WYZ-15_(1-7)]|nr:hypothetical protein [Sandaracinus sp.]HJL04055.1 hypothetical protein [Polyangiaceae bacterium LLY-WYZ-15_(1-7)]HJL08320.1 hypothetical protein [Polyangiaceae bacterium LLY-WYZ-15_(1-7)]
MSGRAALSARAAAALLALALALPVGARAQAPSDAPEEPAPAAAPAPPPATTAPEAGAEDEPAPTGGSTAPSGGTTTPPPSASPAGTATTPRNAAADDPAPPAERVLEDDQDPDEAAAEEDEENWGVFWIEAMAGYSFANLVTFKNDNFIPESENLEGSGIVGGAALGFRIYFLTLGARATIASYFGFELGTVGADIAIHLPIPVVQPYIRVGLGYAWMGDADYEDPSLSTTDVYGLAIDAGLGVDIKLGRVLSIGAGFDAAFLNMGRQGADEALTIGEVNLEESGDAVGLQLRVHGHLTFHI